MTALAVENLGRIGAGHVFGVFLKNVFPISVLPALKALPEVCRIFCATANPLEAVVAVTDLGRGVLGVVDGQPPLGEETEAETHARIDLLRTLGYKQG
jgi:hypothetical protein